jgi:2,3-bisphosphoglycerate-independent phosphoglycerate mutase
VLLIILDGCGVGRKDETNPLFVAHTPVLDDLIKNVPYTELAASGEAVGLMKGKNGNSESGHMNIATGRIVLQDDVRIEQAIRDGSFYENEAFLLAIKNAKENNGSLHLLTMLSKGSSHGSMDYALELLQLAGRERLRRVFVHLIFDGRSTERGKTPALLSEFSKDMIDIGVGRIVTGMGRGYALDRDGNYLGKTKVAYDALVFGKGRKIRVPIRG